MSAQRVVAWLSVAAIAAAVVAGLAITGTPAEQRVRRLDERRLMDIQALSGAVNRYWNNRHELPSRPEDVIDGQITTRLPLDPESKQPYDYRAIDVGRYELCATFTRSSREASNDFWFHEAGRRCFSLDAEQPGYARGVPRID